MPELDFRSPRLFVDAALARGRDESRWSATRAIIWATCCGSRPAKPSWCSTAATANGRPQIEGRKRPDALSIVARTRPQDRLPDIAYVFAPLKHARLDYMVQKAVEMGASALQPVLTRHHPGLAGQHRADARQCHRGRRAMRHPEPCRGRRARWRSTAFSRKRETSRLLVFCDEAADIGNPIKALQQGLSATDGYRRRNRPRGRICRRRTRAAAAAAQDAAAVVGPPHPARGYRRRRRAGAGAGRAGGLDGTGLAPTGQGASR